MFCKLSFKNICNCLYWCTLKMNYWATCITGGTMLVCTLQNIHWYTYIPRVMLYTKVCMHYGWLLTCAHKRGRIRIPHPICSTHSHHPPVGNKSWVTSEEYLGTLSCVLIGFNEAIPRNSWITAVDWRRGERIHYAIFSENHSAPY